ncbi:MAG: hypothetical protein ACREJV_10050, partial [Candidatus Rokuibacteriota bacterium]
MLTPRNLMTLFLLAALVPVVVVGVGNWRETFQPGLASAVPAPNLRPQLGRSGSRWSPQLGRLGSVDGESFPTASPRSEQASRRGASANPRADADAAYAMMLT